MVILPLQTARVSNALSATLATQQVTQTQNQLLVVEQELATGKQVNRPSDNPAAAAVIQQLQQTLDDHTQYATNISRGTDQLNQVDSTLTSVTGLLTQAQSVAQANVSTTTSAAARASDASVVDGIYDQVLSTANASYEGEYLFGGDSGTAPYVTGVDGGIQFNGSENTLSNTYAEKTDLSFQVAATSVFGGRSASISAGTDLDPTVTAATPLSSLTGTGTTGVHPGVILVGSGSATRTVDLSGAATLGDVVAGINAAGLPGVTASLTANGVQLTGTGSAAPSARDLDGGTLAADLGIAVQNGTPGTPDVGGDLGPTITDQTPLSSLRNGAGIDTTGFVITAGTVTKTISLQNLATVQDLVNAVNTAGAGVHAAISADGSHIDLTNDTQGVPVSIAEAAPGGQTAAELGFRTFATTTPVANLNGGAGVGTPAGTQFTLTARNGNVYDISLANLTTVGSALAQIGTQTNGNVTAALSTTGNGIVLTDHTPGGANLVVTPVGAATTAADLGLVGAGAVTAGSTVTGTDVSQVNATGVLGDLKALSTALKANDTDGIAKASVALQADSANVTDAQAIVGGRVQELTSRTADMQNQNTATQTLLSQFQDVDYAAVTTQYQSLQNSYEASLRVTAMSMQQSLMDYLTD